MTTTGLTLRAPYLLFVGEEHRPTYAKTARGIADWRRKLCMGQLRLTDNAVDLGLEDCDVSAAVRAGAGSLIVGTAPVGGRIPDNWIPILAEAARAGLDIVAGLHTRLSSIPDLVQAASEGGVALVDVRVPPAELPVGSGRKRSGNRVLTVGTDCALGKKYTALQLERDLRDAGVKATFRASGQTGIMIAGSGIPMDCVVADFISGAAELLSPDNDEDHWDVIEGQGGIFHPGYAAVSHGLLLGSQPDAFVVCHATGRRHIEGWDGFALPTIDDVIERTIAIGRLTNPAIRCVGISINTQSMDERGRWRYQQSLSDKYGLPCVDPLRDGTGAIVQALQTMGG